MTENIGKWPSGHSKTETIRSSDGRGETSAPSTMVRGYDFYRPGGYLGNVGENVHKCGKTHSQDFSGSPWLELFQRSFGEYRFKRPRRVCDLLN